MDSPAGYPEGVNWLSGGLPQPSSPLYNGMRNALKKRIHCLTTELRRLNIVHGQLDVEGHPADVSTDEEADEDIRRDMRLRGEHSANRSSTSAANMAWYAARRESSTVFTNRGPAFTGPPAFVKKPPKIAPPIEKPNATPLHLLVCRHIDGCSARLKNAPPGEFFCPISHSAMQDPVTAEDGRVYDRLFISKYTGSARTWISPVTREPMGVGPFGPTPFHPCRSMCSLMERWVRTDLNLRETASLKTALDARYKELRVVDSEDDDDGGSWYDILFSPQGVDFL